MTSNDTIKIQACYVLTALAQCRDQAATVGWLLAYGGGDNPDRRVLLDLLKTGGYLESGHSLFEPMFDDEGVGLTPKGIDAVLTW